MATCPKCGASLGYDLGSGENFCMDLACGFTEKSPPFRVQETAQAARGDDSASPVEIHSREREIAAETLEAALRGRLRLPSWQDWLRRPFRSFWLARRVWNFRRMARLTREFTRRKMNEESMYRRIFPPERIDS